MMYILLGGQADWKSTRSTSASVEEGFAWKALPIVPTVYLQALGQQLDLVDRGSSNDLWSCLMDLGAAVKSSVS